MKQTHYTVLQISPDASPEVIEASWKALMRKYHPEGTEPNYEMAVRVNQAHDVLADPDKRAAYDASLHVQTAGFPEPPAGSPSGYPGEAYPPAYPSPFVQTFMQSARQASEASIEEFVARLAEDMLPSAVDEFLRHVPPALRPAVRAGLKGRRRNPMYARPGARGGA